MTGFVIAALTFATWLYLALARGGFWRGAQNDRSMHDALGATTDRRWPRIVAVIPARNEAELIGTTVSSLLSQRYAGSLSIVVVDDHSDDGTAQVARDAAARLDQHDRLTILEAPPLPSDWTGKLWALSRGVAHVEASAEAPEYLLLTDADIRYDANAVAALVSSAVDQRLALSSLMVHLRCESFAERALIPAFVFFFQMLYPFAWIRQPHRRTAAAAGGCVLIRGDALREAGGIASIRGSLIDDCALARRMKPHGAIQLALAEHVQSLRAYRSVDDVRKMIVRSAYAQLGFSPLLLVAVVAAMAMVFVAPVLAAIAGQGWTRALGLAAWIAMALLFVPIQKRYRVPAWWGVALPAIASTYLAFTVESAVQHWSGRGGQWKGRINNAAVGNP